MWNLASPAPAWEETIQPRKEKRPKLGPILNKAQQATSKKSENDILSSQVVEGESKYQEMSLPEFRARR